VKWRSTPGSSEQRRSLNTNAGRFTNIHLYFSLIAIMPKCLDSPSAEFVKLSCLLRWYQGTTTPISRLPIRAKNSRLGN